MAKKSQQTLFLSENADLEVKVHPVVLFSILDSYLRRPESQVRVIGTLLGKIDGKNVEVTNSFAVPHLEKNDEVAVGKDFNHQMFSLQQLVNSKEQILGWYATTYTGLDITDSSSLIHDFYTSECESPVHLVVDTSLQNNEVGLKAYISSPIIIGGEAIANMFHQVKVSLAMGEAERICIDRMYRGQEEPFTASQGLASFTNELYDLEDSMQNLLSLLDTAAEYVNSVVAGTREANESVGRQISQALATVPRMRSEAFDQMFNTNLQDLLMISYLTNLTKTQMSIAAKLNETLN